jgi:hypothetical protein
MSSWQIEHHRLQTPREDREALIEPPLERVGELVDDNLRLRDQLHYDLSGRSFAEISQMARAELLAAARQWTAAYRDVRVQPPDPHGLIFLAGHQPEMFHPGVWLKNFALGELAARHGATAVNLVVDSDTLSDASLRVPGGSVAEPRAIQIAFDRPDPKIPYEERRIEDRPLWDTFAHRVREQLGPLVADPLIGSYWPLVRARAEQCDNLGACLTQARHQLEGAWGLETLEVPQSRVCDGEAFRWFTAYLLAELPRFHATYNQSVREYRRLYRVRSLAHPVPDLAQELPWREVPLWVWTADDPRRRRLFARFEGGETVLSDRQSWEVRLPLEAEGRLDRAAERLRALHHAGVRIRSRALVTTLWARLALGDLFLHGIGGAKYDRVTDRWIERCFGFQPPAMMVLSATLHLPIDRPWASTEELRAIERELRELRYHPERYLDGLGGTAGESVSAKRQWVATPQIAENARLRCQAIRRANAALQPKVADRRQQLERRQAETVRRLHAEGVLAWREYAFCLYPETTLREFLSGLLHKMS